MSWERSGTVTVANGSNVVAGAGTQWAVPVVAAGHSFRGPDGVQYEIEALNSATELTLATPYLGPSAAGQAYAVIPSAGISVELHRRIVDLITQANDHADNSDNPHGTTATQIGALAKNNPAVTGTLSIDGGIHFGGTGAADLLDDYEEGSWTPVLGGNSGASGQVYNSQNGHYVKIGSLVMVRCYISLASKGTFSGPFTCIHGLPFAAHGSKSFQAVGVGYTAGLASAVGSPAGYINPNTSTVLLTGQSGNANTLGGFPQSAIADTSAVMMSGTYLTAS